MKNINIFLSSYKLKFTKPYSTSFDDAISFHNNRTVLTLKDEMIPKFKMKLYFAEIEVIQNSDDL